MSIDALHVCMYTPNAPPGGHALYYYSVTSHKSFCGNALWLSTGDRVLVIACVQFFQQAP